MSAKPNDETLKPSERIEQIAQERGFGRYDALCAYLDERHAAGQGEQAACGKLWHTADLRAHACELTPGHAGYCNHAPVSRVEGAAEAKPECHHHRLTKDCHECHPVASPKKTDWERVRSGEPWSKPCTAGELRRAGWCPAHQCAMPCKWCANSPAEAERSEQPAPGSRVLEYPDAPLDTPLCPPVAEPTSPDVYTNQASYKRATSVAEPPSPVAGEPAVWPELMAELRSLAATHPATQRMSDLAENFEACGVVLQRHLAERKSKLTTAQSALEQANARVKEVEAERKYWEEQAERWQKLSNRNHDDCLKAESALKSHQREMAHALGLEHATDTVCKPADWPALEDGARSLVKTYRSLVDEFMARGSALTEANARFERSQAQTDDYEKALEAERRHTSLLTQQVDEANARAERSEALLLSVHDLASSRLADANIGAEPRMWRHDVREIEQLSIAQSPKLAGEPVEQQRAIVVGSTWRYKGAEPDTVTVAAIATETRIGCRSDGLLEFNPTEKVFREDHTWLSDPPATSEPVTGEKPRE